MSRMHFTIIGVSTVEAAAENYGVMNAYSWDEAITSYNSAVRDAGCKVQFVPILRSG